MKKIKITSKNITSLIAEQSADFPKYATQIINLANQNAGGTRPKMVGQMSDLIQEFDGTEFKKWEEWYLKKHPDAIANATKKVVEMVENLKLVITKIDEKMVEAWVRDLVIVKTFVGLKFQEAIFKEVALYSNKTYRLATPKEESIGIDGFIDTIALSIKPKSYQQKSALQEKIEVPIIFYEKMKDGINIYFDENLFI